MKVIDMGLNTTKGDPKWDSLVAEFKATVEEDGEAQARWSCTGRTRHEWQSYMLQEELQDEPWEWEIDYWSYLCIARKEVEKFLASTLTERRTKNEENHLHERPTV